MKAVRTELELRAIGYLESCKNVDDLLIERKELNYTIRKARVKQENMRQRMVYEVQDND